MIVWIKVVLVSTKILKRALKDIIETRNSLNVRLCEINRERKYFNVKDKEKKINVEKKKRPSSSPPFDFIFRAYDHRS